MPSSCLTCPKSTISYHPQTAQGSHPRHSSYDSHETLLKSLEPTPRDRLVLSPWPSAPAWQDPNSLSRIE